MTNNIDQTLTILGAVRLPTTSAEIERAVMARISAVIRDRQARPSLGVGVGAALAAMFIGMAFVNIAPVSEQVPLELSAFSAHAAFAHATLLATAG